MDESTTLLLHRVAILRSQIKEAQDDPSLEMLSSLLTQLEQAVERANQDRDALAREKDQLARRNLDLAQKNEALLRQKDLLERQKENLERQLKTIERHNTNLLRQNSQVERHNAALEEGRTALELEKKRYRNLFEYSPDAFLITDSSGVVIEANQAAASMLNAAQRELKGEGLLEYIAPQHKKLFMTLLRHLQRVQDVELCIQPRGRAGLDTSLTLSTFYDSTGKPVILHWMLRDITERRRAMAQLNASERRFRTIFNEARMGILLLDREGKIVRANRAFQEMLGYSEDELTNRPLASLVCAEDAPIQNTWLTFDENRLPNSGHLHVVENRFQRRDEEYLWTSVSISTLRDDMGNPLFLLAMVNDVSREKQTAIELAEMRRQLVESGEVERMRLAQDLHDGPTQDLYAAAFRASNFQDKTGDPETQQNLAELQALLKQVANNLRDVVAELRPPTIANLGLERAIRSHAERLQEKHPELEIKLHLTPDGKNLPAHTRLAFFRVYQQCIANILRHSQATQAVIAFHLDEKEMSLDIWDNGKGFDVPTRWMDLMREGHYGLAGIAERVQALRGTLKVESRPGAGTLIHVVAPREEAAR